MATRRVKADGFYNTYIGPASRWANPYVSPRDGTDKEVVLKYKDWVYSQPQMLQDIKTYLKDKALGCWCSQSKLCHGDVLVTAAETLHVEAALPLGQRPEVQTPPPMDIDKITQMITKHWQGIDKDTHDFNACYICNIANKSGAA